MDGFNKCREFLKTLKISLKKGDGIISQTDIKKLSEKERSTATETLKNAVLPDFLSPKLEPLLSIKVKPLKMKCNLSDYAYFIHLGYIHNFKNSASTVSKSLFLKDDKSFSMLLEDFYMSLLKGVTLQKIRKAICDEKCLHVVVFYRQRILTRKNDVTFLDTIIAAASFHIIPQLTLLTWMGVDSSLQFNEDFGATKVDPKKKIFSFKVIFT